MKELTDATVLRHAKRILRQHPEVRTLGYYQLIRFVFNEPRIPIGYGPQINYRVSSVIRTLIANK